MLIIKDITTVQGSFGEVINEGLLLKSEGIELWHLVAQNLEVIEFVHSVVEWLFLFAACAECYERKAEDYYFFHCLVFKDLKGIKIVIIFFLIQFVPVV